jgi:proteasome lid subunit RPN8/RPN11
VDEPAPAAPSSGAADPDAPASRLVLPAAAHSAIARHAEGAYPEEACGILVGRFAEAPDGGRSGARVERALPAENVHSDRRRRYAIAPEALLAAQRRAREEGCELVGYYHSHPDHPPRPSATDRSDAWPGVSYLIVAVAAGRAGEARSWRWDAEAGRFVEEAVEVVPRR